MLPDGIVQAGGEGQAMAQQAKAQEMVRFKQQMDTLKQRLEQGPGKEKELRQACMDFEAVFMGNLWKEMQATVPKEGYLHGKTDEMYLGMFEQPFSEHLAASGGIGLADMLYDQLASRLKTTSNATLPGNVHIKPVLKPLAENGRADIKPLAESLPTVNTSLVEDAPRESASIASEPSPSRDETTDRKPGAVQPDKRVDELSPAEVKARMAALAESLAEGLIAEVADGLNEPSVAAQAAVELVADASRSDAERDPARTWDQAVVGPRSEPAAASPEPGPIPEPESVAPVAQPMAQMDEAVADDDNGWVSADAVLSRP